MLLEKSLHKKEHGENKKPLNSFVNVVGHIRRTAKFSKADEENIKSPVTLYNRQWSNGPFNADLNKKSPTSKQIPKWVDNIDKNHINHSGEAPIFTENFLSSSKDEQYIDSKFTSPTEPTSKSRRKFANTADQFCQTHRTRNYLLASKIPSFEDEDRQTRAARLRNTHREQLQSAAVYNAARIEHKRKKDRPQTGDPNKKWLPTKYQLHDAPQSFMVGTRYNLSSQRDLKSFAHIGLYLPKVRPATSYLKNFQGSESQIYDRFANEREKNRNSQYGHVRRSQTRSTSIDFVRPSQRPVTSSSNLYQAIRSYTKKPTKSPYPTCATAAITKSKEIIPQLKAVYPTSLKEKNGRVVE